MQVDGVSGRWRGSSWDVMNQGKQYSGLKQFSLKPIFHADKIPAIMSWTFRHPHFLWLLALAAVPLVREFVWKPAAAALGFSATAPPPPPRPPPAPPPRAAPGGRGPPPRRGPPGPPFFSAPPGPAPGAAALPGPQAGDEQSK